MFVFTRFYTAGLVLVGLGMYLQTLGLYLQVWARICRFGLVFVRLRMAALLFEGLGLYLQLWACICKSGFGFGDLGL